jgi:hypothetical protein
MRRPRWLPFVLVAGLAACSGDKQEKSGPRGSAGLAPSTTAMTTPAATTTRSKAGKAPAAKPAKNARSAPAGIDAGVKEEPTAIAQEELHLEEPEANPYSESVTLKLSVSPQVKAQVNFGAKVLARLEPGKMDTEIVRPRGSGPVDLDIKAEGYLPYHTRLYADRNDKLGVRLYRPEEAPNLFGYKRSPEGRKVEAERAAKAEQPR